MFQENGFRRHKKACIVVRTSPVISMLVTPILYLKRKSRTVAPRRSMWASLPSTRSGLTNGETSRWTGLKRFY